MTLDDFLRGDDGSPYTRQVLRATSPDEHHAVLLEVVPLSGYVRLEDLPRREPHARDLAFRRVGLLGLRGEDLHDDALPLGVVVQEGGPDQSLFVRTSTAHRLVERSECWRGGVEGVVGCECC